MKLQKCILLLLFWNIFFLNADAQSVPDLISYQVVIRDASNKILDNKSVKLRISILQGSESGQNQYTETQTVSTNINGLASLKVGAGSIISGNFATIDWSNGPFFIKTEIDPNGGNQYSIMGTQQLLSVPFAIYAKSSGSSIPGPAGPKGEKGEQGTSGVDGKSAYELAVEDGYSGTESEWLSSLKGEKGDDGPAGNGFQNGTQQGEMLYWDGNAWIKLSPGNQNEILTFCDGSPIWTRLGKCSAKISELKCNEIIVSGLVIENIQVTNTSISIKYTGGNEGVYEQQNFLSSGVTGLTAILEAGVLVEGQGELNLQISGKANQIGDAYFSFSIGGQTCLISIQVIADLSYSNDFETCNLNDFTYSGGTINISNSAFQGNCAVNMSHLAGQQPNNFFPKNKNFGFGTYKIMAIAPDVISDNLIHLFQQDALSGGLFISCRPSNTDNPGLTVNGLGINYETTSINVNRNQWYEIKIEVFPQVINVFVAGSLRFTTNSFQSPGQGRFKLGVAYSGRFDNMSFTPYTN